MMLWLIWQDDIDEYDTYIDAVVVAPDAELARRIHPSSMFVWSEELSTWVYRDGGEAVDYHSWVNIDNVHVELIGVAMGNMSSRVVCASFCAG